MKTGKLTRRKFVATTAAASATMIAAPFVRTANAAGKLSIGFWDHWVPGANKATTAIVQAWAEKEKVEVSIDYVPSAGQKNVITIAAEAQAKAGHDIFAHPSWSVQGYSELLEPVDDVMADLVKEHGKVNPTVEYLARVSGKWLAVPATSGSQIKGPCSRIDLMKSLAGIDVQEMYPAGAAPKADNWTLETYLKAAEACFKGGKPFGVGLGTTPDSVDTAGAFFHAHGATLVDEKGNMTVKSDKVRAAMEYCKKVAAFYPPDAPAWDDASNNKWLVAGNGALIMNPPSAWAVAKRDAPQVAEQCWTHGFPSGPAGRFSPFLPYFWAIWGFSKNKPAAKSLLAALSTRAAAEQMVAASNGYDLPSFEKLTDFKTWAEEGPPKGTLYHYPNPHNHQVLAVAAAPAPPKIAFQIYSQGVQTKMIVRFLQGEALEKTLAWAESECEGFLRT
jgi:ABC-type glycerol-3-phosphate transport system substrate-binding protein